MLKNKCYSQEDLSLFKYLILEKLEKAKTELTFLKEESSGNENDTKDTSGSYSKDEREKDVSFNLNRIEKKKTQIKELEDASLRIDNGDYGICNCSVCRGELILKERLLAVPEAVKCALEIKKTR